MSRVIKSSFVIETNERQYKSSKNNNTLEKEVEKEKEEILKKAKLEKQKIIDAAKDEAERIIVNANKKAENLLSETYDKSTEVIEDYKDKGYKEGYEIGLNKGKQESSDIINEALQIKQDIHDSRRNMIAKLEKDVIEIVTQSCTKIINRLYEEDKEIILSIIQKGIDSLGNSSTLRVKVSEFDYDFLQMYKNKINAMATSVEKFEIVIDKSLNKGGIIIETPKGSVDVGIETQINELEKILTELLNSE